MAQEFTTAAKNQMLDALTTVWISAHTGDPGLTGANEVTGGAPAYARKLGTYAAAAAAAKALTGSVVLDIPAATTVSYIGIWTLATGGVFLGQKDVVDEVFASQGTLTVTQATLSLPLNP